MGLGHPRASLFLSEPSTVGTVFQLIPSRLVFWLKQPRSPFAAVRPHTRRLESEEREMAAASFRWILQLHKDVPKAARFYSEGLDFTVNVCTLRWAELQSGPLKLALMQSPKYVFFTYLVHALFLFVDMSTRTIKHFLFD